MLMIKKIFKELNRRGVFRALGAYIAIVWLLAQGLVDLFPAVGLPDWTIRIFLTVAVVATPLVLFLAWRYDLTRKGLLRDRVDVARARHSAATGVFGPTQHSILPQNSRRSIVEVFWTDETGKEYERQYRTAFVIGRDFDADVILRDDRVSRRHVRVYPDGENWYVKDLASLNGTYVDGRRIDVERIQQEIEFALHKNGPRIRLVTRDIDETSLTARPT